MSDSNSNEPVIEDFESIEDYIRAFEAFHDNRTPSPRDTIQRSARIAGESIRGINLQIRRIRTAEPEDIEWNGRVFMDCYFLIMSLWRLRLAAHIAASVPQAHDRAQEALVAFDRRLPDLERMRNVSQHIDDYATDHPKKRRQTKPGTNSPIGRRILEAGSLSNDLFCWLGGTISLAEAGASAAALYTSVIEIRDSLIQDGELG